MEGGRAAAASEAAGAARLSREELMAALERWNEAWAAHDLDAVMELFHDEVVFEHWTGSAVTGKDSLREAWVGWFADHGGFRFTQEDLFVDEVSQTGLYRWTLDWPSLERGVKGRHEARRGVDVLRFEDGKLIEKLTYSKTSILLDGEETRLRVPEAP